MCGSSVLGDMSVEVWCSVDNGSFVGGLCVGSC